MKIDAKVRASIQRMKLLEKWNKLATKTANKFGTYMQQDTRRLIGKTSNAKPRPAPKPPRQRQNGDAGLRRLRYEIFRNGDGVICRVGFTKNNRPSKAAGKWAPEVHEFGATGTVYVIQRYATKFREYRNKKGGLVRTKRSMDVSLVYDRPIPGTVAIGAKWKRRPMLLAAIKKPKIVNIAKAMKRGF